MAAAQAFFPERFSSSYAPFTMEEQREAAQADEDERNVNAQPLSPPNGPGGSHSWSPPAATSAAMDTRSSPSKRGRNDEIVTMINQARTSIGEPELKGSRMAWDQRVPSEGDEALQFAEGDECFFALFDDGVEECFTVEKMRAR